MPRCLRAGVEKPVVGGFPHNAERGQCMTQKDTEDIGAAPASALKANSKPTLLARRSARCCCAACSNLSMILACQMGEQAHWVTASAGTAGHKAGKRERPADLMLSMRRELR